MKALLLLNCEPLLDTANAAATRKALSASGLVVALTSFKDVAADVADVMLPIAPFTETGGSFVNAEGRLQSFHGVVKPLSDTRPGWKVLRVLGNLLGLPGFDFETVESVTAAALGDAASLQERLNNNALAEPAVLAVSAPAKGLERVADVPIYSTDTLVRRAASLQATADGRAPLVGVPSGLWQQLRLQPGAKVLVGQGETAVVLPAQEDASLAATAVRIAAGHPSTVGLGAMFGAITLEAV